MERKLSFRLEPDFSSGGTEESVENSAIKSKDTSAGVGMTSFFLKNIDIKIAGN